MDWLEVLHNAAALGIAAVLGGLLGLEREVHKRWAGLRTHMLVAVGTCVFLLAGMTASDEGHRAEVVSRVIQGICAGIGFIGAGTILKLTDKLEVKGLTTASSIWTAAAVGTACGIHHYDLAILGTVFALIILFGFRLCERWLGPPLQEPTSAHDETGNESPQTHRQKKRKMQEGLDKRNRGQTP